MIMDAKKVKLVVIAGRQGSLWPSAVQCPDCDEGVIFRVVEQ